jgi:hypothetical protein
MRRELGSSLVLAFGLPRFEPLIGFRQLALARLGIG